MGMEEHISNKVGELIGMARRGKATRAERKQAGEHGKGATGDARDSRG